MTAKAGDPFWLPGEEYHIDVKHVGVWGASAGRAPGGACWDRAGCEGVGGVLEGILEKNSQRARAVCAWFGPTDLLVCVGGGAEKTLESEGLARVRSRGREAAGWA